MAEAGEDDFSDENDEDTPSESAPAVVPKKPKYSVKSYDCCICNQSEPSTPESPIALVAFQQPTRVLGARVREDHPNEVLPCDGGIAVGCLYTFFLKLKHVIRGQPACS